MIASPSRPDDRPGGKNENENYFFQWPRDGGLCLKEVVRKLKLAELGVDVGVDGETVERLDTIIEE